MNDDTLFRIMPLYHKGFCCSQIILMLGLEAAGMENPQLIRAATGLCFGMGTGNTCGALTGGACLLGLYAGKGTDAETAGEKMALMLEALTSWFSQNAVPVADRVQCADILGKTPLRPNPDVCGRLIADTVDQCMTILADSGYDPGDMP